MNAEGRLVQQPIYDTEIGEFKQFGYATMQRKGRVGLLNSEGIEIVPPAYDDVKALDSTLISVINKANGRSSICKEKSYCQPDMNK